MDAAFYCMSSEIYFLGAVGMINSLRLQGHTEPVFLLDCGLTAGQRELLAPHATLVPAPAGVPPYLLKTVAPLAHPAEVTVLIDADMIVTRSISGLIATASEGRVVAFENSIDRYVPEWSELLDLGPIRRGRYVSSGLVVLGGGQGRDVLELFGDRLRSADFDFDYDFSQPDPPEHPLRYLDQDVLNAVLHSRLDPQCLVTLDTRLAPIQPFEGLRVVDLRALRCTGGEEIEPYVIHHILPSKPWLVRGHESPYSRLLRRLLCGADVPIRVPRSEVPLRLRTGALAAVDQRWANVREQLRWRLGGFVRERSGAQARGRAAG